MPEADARATVLHRFRWVDGHADVWRLFHDGADLALIVAALAQPWRDNAVSHVVGTEARGFLLGVRQR